MSAPVTKSIPNQALIFKLSSINKAPVMAAIKGDRASIERVFLVPIRFKDFK